MNQAPEERTARRQLLAQALQLLPEEDASDGAHGPGSQEAPTRHASSTADHASSTEPAQSAGDSAGGANEHVVGEIGGARGAEGARHVLHAHAAWGPLGSHALFLFTLGPEAQAHDRQQALLEGIHERWGAAWSLRAKLAC